MSHLLIQGVGDGDVLLADFPYGSLSEPRVLRFGEVSGGCVRLMLNSIVRVEVLNQGAAAATGTTGGTRVRLYRRLLWDLLLHFFLLAFPSFFYASISSHQLM